MGSPRQRRQVTEMSHGLCGCRPHGMSLSLPQNKDHLSQCTRGAVCVPCNMILDATCTTYRAGPVQDKKLVCGMHQRLHSPSTCCTSWQASWHHALPFQASACKELYKETATFDNACDENMYHWPCLAGKACSSANKPQHRTMFRSSKP